MLALSVYLCFNLGQGVREVIVNFDMGGIQITPEDAVRTGEDAALHEVDGLVAAADVIPGPGAVPDEISPSYCVYPW